MTTSPLPPPSYPEYAKNSVSKGGEIVKIVIRPALYTADQMQAYATQARADLEAENQRLREALEELLRHFTRSPSSLADSKTRIKAHAALESKP